jgi:hypothetical protein
LVNQIELLGYPPTIELAGSPVGYVIRRAVLGTTVRRVWIEYLNVFEGK